MARKYQKFGLALGAAVLSTQVFAQSTEWTITYGPQAASVPTLSEWAMMALVLMMAAFAVYTLRKRGAGAGPLASVLLVSALALGGVAGNSLLNDALADLLPAMTSDSGGTVPPFSTNPGDEFGVQNNTHMPQTITGVSPASDPTNGTRCAPGVIVPVNGSCYVVKGQQQQPD